MDPLVWHRPSCQLQRKNRAIFFDPEGFDGVIASGPKFLDDQFPGFWCNEIQDTFSDHFIEFISEKI